MLTKPNQCYLTSCKFDFLPDLEFSNSHKLELVEEYKLLGVVISSNMSWQAHVDSICSKAYKRMWLLRRLKKLGAVCGDLLTVYSNHIRCLVEFGVAAWNSGLNKAQVKQLERIQKSALAIILAEGYLNFENAMSVTGLESLEFRRKRLCREFARKASRNPNFAHWFCPLPPPTHNTRAKRPRFAPVQARTLRYKLGLSLAKLSNLFFKLGFVWFLLSKTG